MRDSAQRITLTLCLVQILALSGSLNFQSLIPQFIEIWGLTNAEAGWIGSASYLAYAGAAPLLAALTDRIDARRVVLAACTVSALAGIGFALFAHDFWSALAWRALAGIGIAGSYMPGLKALTDRTEGPQQGRYQSFYTASFSLGSAFSMLQAGVVADLLGWQAAFIGTAILTAAGGLLVLAFLPARQPLPAPKAQRPGGNLMAVLRNRVAMGHVMAYAAHCWELFAFRTWIVAFLTFAAASGGQSIGTAGIAALGTLMVMIGLPASILGNEAAMRYGRRRTLQAIMGASALLALLLGFLSVLPFWLLVPLTLVYGALVMGDSAAITIGTLAGADPARRGLTIAVQTLLGSLAAMTSPLLCGVALDAFGADSVRGWGLSFAMMGLGVALGPLALHLAREPSKDARS